MNSLLIGQARTVPLLHFSSPLSMLSKAITEVLALLLFLAGIWVIRREYLHRPSVIFLIAAAVPSILLRPVFDLGAGANEYKFLFSAALCLAPIGALAIDRLAPSISAPGFVAAGVVLVLVAIPSLRVQQATGNSDALPDIDESGFFIALQQSSPDAGWIEAVRKRTPRDTVVVAKRCTLFLPPLLQRSLWTPPEHDRPMPGYWLGTEWNLAEERGYDRNLLKSREDAARCIYGCIDPLKLQSATAQIHALHRPIAIVFNGSDGFAFQAMLRRDTKARIIYPEKNGVAVWLLEH